jgi:hypothetical protein
VQLCRNTSLHDEVSLRARASNVRRRQLSTRYFCDTRSTPTSFPIGASTLSRSSSLLPKAAGASGAQTAGLVPFRYLLGFVPVTLPIRKFFADAIQDEAELKSLEEAWTKAVILHVALWSRAYLSDSLW